MVPGGYGALPVASNSQALLLNLTNMTRLERIFLILMLGMFPWKKHETTMLLCWSVWNMFGSGLVTIQTLKPQFQNFLIGSAMASTFRSRLFLDPYLGSIIILIHYIFTVLGVYYHMLYSCKAKRVLHWFHLSKSRIALGLVALGCTWGR